MALVPTLLSVAAVSLLSLLGALTFRLPRLRRHGVLLVLVAFAAGTLLGDAFLHLLPESIEARGEYSPQLAALLLAGFLFFFFLETVLRWGHAHLEDEHPHSESKGVAPFAWTNLVGDALHNFVDGMVIAVAWIADPAKGIATTVAVAAHEIPQELGDFAVLLRSGMRASRALLYNLLSALIALLGAAVVFLFGIDAEFAESYAVPIIAGGFIYIAAADLIPELHHHSERRAIPGIVFGIVLGLAVMTLLLLSEGLLGG